MSDVPISISDRSVKEALKNIKKYSKKKQEMVKRATGESAINVHSGAVNNCPVDTGRLRSSLHVVTKKTKSYRYSDNNGKGYNGTLNVTAKEGSAIVGTNVEYATDVEYGGTRTGEQPFLRPAAMKEKPKFIAKIKKILKKK